jgi:transposase
VVETLVVETLREIKSVAQIAAENDLHPNLVTKWKQAALAGLPDVFERQTAEQEKAAAQEEKIAELYQEIGRLTTQVNWLKKIWFGARHMVSECGWWTGDLKQNCRWRVKRSY